MTAVWGFLAFLYIFFCTSHASGCKSRKTQFKAFKFCLFFSLLNSGVPDRVRWPTDHLLDVLLPPSFHIFSEI